MAKTFQEDVSLGPRVTDFARKHGWFDLVVNKDFDEYFFETHHQVLGCTQRALFTCQWLMIVSASELKS